MSREERSHITNAIWLCATHANLIDRDEVTYTADVLRAMKSEHEANCAERQRSAILAGESIPDLIAIGPDIVFVGEFLGLVAAAGETAIALDILPWPKGTALLAAKECFKTWREARGGAGAAEERDERLERSYGRTEPNGSGENTRKTCISYGPEKGKHLSKVVRIPGIAKELRAYHISHTIFGDQNEFGDQDD